MTEDKCQACGETYDIECNPFNAFGRGRYTAHCRCTAEAEKKRIEEQKGGFKSTYSPPTLGDLLRLPNQ